MSEFISIFINEKRSEWLVKALIEVIQNDFEIDKSTFFNTSISKTFTKENFNKISYIELPIFLLSVLHFIITQRIDNTKGRKTFEQWHSQKIKKSSWNFISSVGQNNRQNISVKTTVEIPENSCISSVDSKDNIEANTQTNSSFNKVENFISSSKKVMVDDYIQSKNNSNEKIDSAETTSDNKSKLQYQTEYKSNKTLIKNQTNVVQNGQKNINLTNNGIINIKF